MNLTQALMNKLSGILLLFPLAFPAFADFPFPQGRVNDFAGVLDAGAKTRLLNRIHEVESKTTAEIAVVTIPSLEGMTVEEYATGLFKKWGIGKKKKDNGLLVLVCPPEHKVRIEVGYGLEPTITDGLAGSVIRACFVPAFKKGDFARGITDGVDQLAKFIDGTETAQSWNPPPLEHPEARMDFWDLFGLAVFLSFFVWIGFASLGYGFGAKVSYFRVFGSAFGGIPALLVFCFPDLWGFPGFLILGEAGAAVLIGLWLGHKYPKALNGISSKRGRGGWSSGGGGGGFSGGSFSSDDSFGGGSSGGGGASGSW